MYFKSIQLFSNRLFSFVLLTFVILFCKGEDAEIEFSNQVTKFSRRVNKIENQINYQLIIKNVKLI